MSRDRRPVAVTKRNLLRAAKRVRRNAVTDTILRRDCGICANIDAEFLGDFGYWHLNPYFDSWPHTTGSHAFPVPEGEGEGRWEGDQLSLRLDLLDHIIRELEAEIAGGAK